LGDWQLTLGDFLVIAIVALVFIATFIAFATLLQGWVCRVECARLREEMKRLSDDVRHLVNAEQRRFLKELKSSQKEEDRSKAAE
jgi:hypothetical protein